MSDAQKPRVVMNDEQIKSRLLKMAAEMMRGKGMPPEFFGDWKLAKTTPITARREIVFHTNAARQQCNDWGRRLMEIVDA